MWLWVVAAANAQAPVEWFGESLGSKVAGAPAGLACRTVDRLRTCTLDGAVVSVSAEVADDLHDNFVAAISARMAGGDHTKGDQGQTWRSGSVQVRAASGRVTAAVVLTPEQGEALLRRAP